MRYRLVAVLGVAAIAFIAAWTSMLHGVAFWDTGELQAVGPLMGTAHPTGFPTYVLLGWLASVLLQPFGEPAFRMNLFSGICLAVAAGVTVDLVRALTGRLALGIAAGLGLAFTPIAWTIATHAEAHTLHVALVAILLWLLVAWESRVHEPEAAPAMPTGGAAQSFDAVPRDRGDRFLVAAAVVFGLAAGNHSLTLLLAIPVGLYVLAVDPGIWRRGRLVVACLLALAITLVVVYLELPLRAGPFRAPLVYGTPNTWDGFRYIVLAEQFQGSLSDPFGHLGDKLGQLIQRTIDAFGILAPLIPFAFIVTAFRRPRYALLTGTAVAITCFFNASYVNADISRYYVGPALMAWTWLAILGAAVVDVLVTRQLDAAVDEGIAREVAETPSLPDPPESDGGPESDADRARRADLRFRGAVLAVLIGLVLLVPTVYAVPDRYAALDMSHRQDAAQWLDRALQVMEPNAVVVSWWSYSTPLWYAQCVEGRRTDIGIVDDRTRLDENLGGLTDFIDANLGKRPVYVIRIDPREVQQLAARYQLQFIDGVDASGLTRVVGLKPGQASNGGAVYPSGRGCAKPQQAAAASTG